MSDISQQPGPRTAAASHGFSARTLPAACARYLLGAGATPSLLFLAAVTFLNLILVSYDFATDDQLLYLALIPRYFDPATINPNDIYLNLFVSRTYTTLFLILAPLTRWLGWEWPIFAIFIIVKFFIYWGIWSLAHWLTRDRWAAAFAVLFLMMSAYMRELSVQIYSVNLICRYAVIPFLFFGLKRFWEKRYVASAVLFGLAFQIHAMSTIYWLVAVALCFLYNLREILFEEGGTGRRLNRSAARQLLSALALFAILALPMVIWHWLTPQPPMPADYSRQDWFEFSYVWKHSWAFFSNWSPRHLWTLLLCLVLFFIPLRQLSQDQAWRWVLPMGIGALLVMAIHSAATEIYPFQPLYQLQWFRASDILALFATIGVARVLSAEGARSWCWVAAVAAACFLTAISSDESMFMFSGAALLLLGVMPFEKKQRAVSATLIILLICPVVEWTFFNRNNPLGAANLWSAPVFWALAACLFAAIFYLRPPSEPGNERSAAGPFRRQLRIGACALSLIMLTALVFFAPEWKWRRWGQTPSSGERLAFCWARVNVPGRGPTVEKSILALQHWARTNTPPQAMFFVPPGLNGFRVFSERSVFVENYDGEVGIFSAALAREWQERMRLFGFDPVRKRGMWQAAAAYHKIPPAQWIELSQKYGAEYLVTSRRVKLPFPQLHKAGRYTVWRVTAEKEAPPPAPAP